MAIKIDDLFSYTNEKKPVVAYFSMEYAIEQPLKIYSGGLGFLAGSFLKSAYEEKKPILGIGILWSYGYYDQARNEDGSLKVAFTRKDYSFLEDTGIKFAIPVHGNDVMVKVLLLRPETFQSAPLLLMTTDIPENEYLSQTISYHLYDGNTAARIAQSVLLGAGGAKLLDELGIKADIYHMNEGHALPLVFSLYEKYQSLAKVQDRLVFTTHTPELAGNEEHSTELLEEMSFFGNQDVEKLKEVFGFGDSVNYTLTALRAAKMSNAVSSLHETVSQEMWSGNKNISSIIGITNAQNKKYWADPVLDEAANNGDIQAIIARKRELKKILFREVADQTGKMFDPDVLTIVWARRFAGYKRAAFLMSDMERFNRITNNPDRPVQVLWAGKPYPLSSPDIDLFNHIYWNTKYNKNATILIGYELYLSGLMKQGSDVWLNNPRFPREASGTSGMSAAMNLSVNFSIPDGWVHEFARHGENSFVIPHSDLHLSNEERDAREASAMYDILENQIIPMYYENREKFVQLAIKGKKDTEAKFESARMVDDYWNKLYMAENLRESANELRYADKAMS